MNRLLAVLLLLATLPALAATPQLQVTWVAPKTYVDGTAMTAPLTYQLYVGASGKEVKFGTPVSASPYLLPAPAPGVTQCVQVAAIANGIESDHSTEACATMPYPKPGAVTTVTVTLKTG